MILIGAQTHHGRKTGISFYPSRSSSARRSTGDLVFNRALSQSISQLGSISEFGHRYLHNASHIVNYKFIE
jgi:hypothetical protein